MVWGVYNVLEVNCAWEGLFSIPLVEQVCVGVCVDRSVFVCTYIFVLCAHTHSNCSCSQLPFIPLLLQLCAGLSVWWWWGGDVLKYTSETITHNGPFPPLPTYIHSLSLFWHLFYDCLHIKYLNKQIWGLRLRFAWGLQRGVVVEREGGGWMMTFISKMRKRKKQDWVGGVVVVKGGRKSSSGWEDGEEKKWLICLQSKQAEDSVLFFAYAWQRRWQTGCVCEWACECLCACPHCRGAHPSAFPGDAGGRGRRPPWLVKSSLPYWSNINRAAKGKEIRARSKVARLRTWKWEEEEEEEAERAEEQTGDGGGKIYFSFPQ